jgi:hypothetical protein
MPAGSASISGFLCNPANKKSISTPRSTRGHCIFERKFGEKIGLEIENGMRQNFGTATGTFLAYGHELTLIVAGFEFDSMVFFPENEHIKRNVLGRTGWLDRIILGLIDYEGKIYLSRYY